MSVNAEVATTRAPRRRNPRIVGFDGIRALAALLVLCYHLIPNWRGAGFVGVDIFFVLSGFLITSLLMRAVAVDGRIGFKKFWTKRLRRLLPAVVFATVGAASLARIVGGDSIVQLRWQVAGSLTSTYNWLQIANGAPYFQQRSPLLLSNMWSLAVEMQFYLVWPLILVAIIAFLPARLWPWAALGIGGVSAFLNWYYVNVWDDVTRAYVGTDSHSFGLMVGAAVALWVPKVMVTKLPKRPDAQRKFWGVAAWVGLAGALMIGTFVLTGPWMYPWGMLAASALAGLTVRALLPDVLSPASSTLGWILSTKPFVWFGERSYSIYLWHWPLWVMAFYTLRWSGWATAALVFPLTLIFAEVSYRFVETPIRLHGLRAWLLSAGRLPIAGQRTLVAGAVAAVVLFAFALLSSPAQSSTEKLFTAVAETSPQSAQSTTQSATDATASIPPPVKEVDKESAPEAEPPPNATPAPIRGDQVTIIGDSVTLVSETQLVERLPGVFIDSKVSRPMLNLPSVAEDVRNQGMMREYVVISLAINGFVGDQEIAAMFDAIGPDHKIVLVTGYGPENEHWIFDANAKIREVGASHQDQVRIAEWEPIAASHLENLAGDRTHPDGVGSGLYADEIVRALNSFNQ